MKPFYKITGFSVGLSFLLSSCFSTNPSIISANPENIDRIAIKTHDLTEKELKNWNQADLLLDTIPGMSVTRAYHEFLRKRKITPVIVAVIDSGVDIDHEDLKGKIWINEDEIPGNNIDDDNNGYIDDVNGWNFLGDIVGENMEFVRILRDYKTKFEGKSASDFTGDDLLLFEVYKRAEKEYAKEVKGNQESLAQYEPMLKRLKLAHEFVSKQLGKDEYTLQEVKTVVTTNEEQENLKNAVVHMHANISNGENFKSLVAGFEGYVDYLISQKDIHLNMGLNARKLIGDNENDLADNKYGNNQVSGPDPKKEDAKHGTHVAGIIAANRHNRKGAKGIAEYVKVMPVRAVPDGDEYDKDIALAIRYAVDNGAKVINTSFGKYYSQHPEWVYDAIKYAATKDVLIVNAAGNDGENLDNVDVYPNDQTLTMDEMVDNFITVGALNHTYGSALVANFSNYGSKNVDVFAPGVKIYASTPLNTYEYLKGTSMAAPAVSGVAAVLRGCYPTLKASEIKAIIMESGNATEASVSHGNGKVGSFASISKSGRMVNLYNAIILAEKRSQNK